MTNMMMSTIMVQKMSMVVKENDEAAPRKNGIPAFLIELYVFSSWSCTMDLRTPCSPVEYFSPSQLVEEKKKKFATV